MTSFTRLDEKLIDVPLYAGQDSSINQYTQARGSNALVENGALTTRGEVSTRDGFRTLSRVTKEGDPILVGKQLLAPGNTLFLHDGAKLYAHADVTDQWGYIGETFSAKLSQSAVFQSDQDILEVSSAADEKVTVCAWTESTGLYYACLDNVTQNIIKGRTLLDAEGQSPNVLRVPSAVNPSVNDFQVFWASTSPSTSQFHGAIIRGSNPYQVAFITTIPVRTTANTLHFDVTWDPVQNRVLGIFDDSANNAPEGQYVWTILQFDAALHTTYLMSGTYPQNTLGPAHPFSIGPSTLCTQGYAFSDGFSFYLGSCQSGFPHDAFGKCIFIHDKIIADVSWDFTSSGPGYGGLASVQIVDQYTEINIVKIQWGHPYGLNIASKPFYENGRGYFLAVASDTASTSQAIFVVDEDLNLVGRFYSGGIAANWDAMSASLPTPQLDNNGDIRVLIRQARTLSVTDAGTFKTGIGAAVTTLATKNARLWGAVADDVTYFGGIDPKTFDGTRLVEWGFIGAPRITATKMPAGSGQLTGGTYEISATYAWYDATGKLWRSLPSPPVTVTDVAATGAISIIVQNLSLTLRPGVFIELYATYNIGGQTGIQLAKVATLTNDPVLIKPLGSNTIMDSLEHRGDPPMGPFPWLNKEQTYQLSRPDLQYASGEPLYTTNTGLGFLPAPALNHLHFSGLRLYGTSPVDNAVYVTNIGNSAIPLNFLDTQYVVFPKERDPLQCAVTMDGNLFTASETAWYETNADTTDLSKSYITFIPPRRLAFSAGVSSAASVLVSADGIYYQSGRGITRIDRRLNETLIGEPVKNYTDAVVDAYLHPTAQQIRFAFGQTAVCYDFAQSAWSFARYYAHQPLSHALARKKAYFLTSDGLVYEETPGLHSDGEHPVQMRIVTPWIRPWGIPGWGRTWKFVLHGEYVGPHKLSMQIAYEDMPGTWDTLEHTTPETRRVLGVPPSPDADVFGSDSGRWGLGPTENFGGGEMGATAYVYRGTMPRQKSGSFKFTFHVQPTDAAGGAKLVNLGLLVGILPGEGKGGKAL